MPTQLHLEFFQDGYRRIPGGLYTISTPESKKYLPEQGKKILLENRVFVGPWQKAEQLFAKLPLRRSTGPGNRGGPHDEPRQH